jgi:hypothetical protein
MRDTRQPTKHISSWVSFQPPHCALGGGHLHQGRLLPVAKKRTGAARR